jgi:hypothetical protein
MDTDYLIPIPEIVKLIESRKNRFYVLDHEAQEKVYVTVAEKRNLKYIRTEAHDTPDDKLLSVGDCKVTDRPSYEAASMILVGIKDLLRREPKAGKTG